MMMDEKLQMLVEDFDFPYRNRHVEVSGYLV